MPRITGNQTLGEGATPVITGTDIWRANATTFTAAGAITPGDNAENIYTQVATDILNADNKVISCKNLIIDTGAGPTTTLGTWNLDEVIIDSNDVQQSPNYYTLNWSNVTLHHIATDNTATVTFGNWPGSGTAAPYTFNNVNLWPSPLGADNYISSMACFLTNGRSSSTFNNVSFWNGKTGGDTQGTGIYSGESLVWGLPVLGPIGFTAAGFGGGFTIDGLTILGRFGNTDGGNVGIVVGSADYRGLQANNDTEWRFILDTNTWFINPLHGEPTQGLQTINVFNNTNATISPVLVGTGASTSSTFVKWINEDVANTMYTFSATTDTSNLPSVVAGNIVEDNDTSTPSENGIAFSNQIINNPVLTGQANTRWNTGTTIPLNTPTGKSFRTYSWDRTQWASLNTIGAPVAGATDEQVAQAREDGYDVHDGSGFTTSTNYDNGDVVDVLVSDYASPTALEAALNVLGGVTNGRELGGLVKTVEYEGLVVADGATAKPLPYTFANANLDFGSNSVVLSPTATEQTTAGSLYTIPASSFDVDSDEVVIGLTADNISLLGDYMGTEQKLSLSATNNFTAMGQVNNVTISADTMNFGNQTTGSSMNLTANTINGWSYGQPHAEVAINGVTTVNITQVPVAAGTTTDTMAMFGSDIIEGTAGAVTINADNPLRFKTTRGDTRIVAGTNVTLVRDYTIVTGRTEGYCTILRDDTIVANVPQGAGLNGYVLPGIMPNERIRIVYSEKGRTDYLFDVTPTDPSNAVINIQNFFRDYTSTTVIPEGATMTPMAFTGTGETAEMLVDVEGDVSSEAVVNKLLQEQVKGTQNYNLLIAETGLTADYFDSGGNAWDIIDSDGGTSDGVCRVPNIKFISNSPTIMGYVRPRGIDVVTTNDLIGPSTTGTFTPDGGGATETVTLGVTITAPAGFDPNITAGQVLAQTNLLRPGTDAALQMRNNRFLGIKPQKPE